MPPKKRKSNQMNANDESTDDEVTVPTVKSKRSRESTTAEPGLKFDLEWSEHGQVENVLKGVKPLYYLWSKTEPGCAKVAAFDIDHTVIVTKSGKSFATSAQDWKWFDKCVPGKLKELHESGHRVLFVTNQAGIEKGKVKFGELRSKFETMIRELDIPIFIMVSTGETHFRKPATEMWTFFEKNCNKGVSVNLNESFFVGDAAGRPKNWAPGRSKDFSCADRMFAANLNLKFYTPEEFFLNHKAVKFEWGSVDPAEILKKHESSKKAESKVYHSDKQEIILLVGPPASGKSTFFRRYLKSHNYVHVNRDTLQTQEKCLKAAEQALKEGKSVCIDNTNPSKRVRSDYIQLAKRYKLEQIRCFRMKTSIELCHHLNYVRQNQTNGKVRRIPDVGYNMYKSQYEEPQVDEGFKEIVEVDFEPSFDSENDEKIFKQWTN